MRFDVDTLRELAGEKTFARGLAYLRAGEVQILSLSPKRVVAQVAGTEDYRTELTGRGDNIDGHCSCPAFRDQGFCKHMVATALAVNAAGDAAEGEAADALARIRKHLTARTADQLVDMILDLAEQDPNLFRKLDLESALTQADDATLEKQLRKAIDAATRTGTYIDYRQAQQWSDGVDSALDAVEDIASGPRAALALKLIERAIARIAAASEAIDDSDGHLGELLGRAYDIHLAAVSATRPEPLALARDLFTREMEDDPGTFGNVVVDYAEVLGDAGLAEYRRLAEAEWKKLPARPGRGGAAADGMASAHRLIEILDFFAEQDSDVETRIALRARDLSSPWKYLQLAEFCLSQGRQEEALRRAEEGLWQFEDRNPDERLLFFVTDQLSKARRNADAEARLWQAFQKAPSFSIYKQLRSTGGKPATQRAVEFLEARLGDKKRDTWRNRPDLLIEILMDEKRFDAAWSILHKFGASEHVKQMLVSATDVPYPREALEFYAVQVERFAASAAYKEAMKVIARMAKLRSAGEQAAFVMELKVRHGRKRNFMKLLAEKA